MPALQFPVIIYSIFTNVAFTYGPLFPTITAGEALIKQLLKGFLTAFAIATGVSLFIIPVSSRTVVFKEQTGYIQLIRATMKAQTAYLQSLETSDMFAPEEPDEDDGDDGKKAKKNKKKDNNSHLAANAQSMALKANLAALTGLHGKLHGDMSFGKREMAWGKLDAKDLDEIFTLFRSILIPLIGMSTITDIFERIAERRGWVRVPNSKFDRAESWEACGLEAKEKEKATWNEIMKTLHEPFEVVRNSLFRSFPWLQGPRQPPSLRLRQPPGTRSPPTLLKCALRNIGHFVAQPLAGRIGPRRTKGRQRAKRNGFAPDGATYSCVIAL